MNENVTVTEMTITDLLSIKNCLEIDFDDFWSFNVLKNELENQNSQCYVAKSQDNIVGFVCIWHVLDEFHITNIVTKKEKRNLGIASCLLKKAIDFSKLNTASLLTLEVNSNNIPALNLYKKFGFSEVGKRNKYYNGTDDAIIMTLYFTNT